MDEDPTKGLPSKRDFEERVLSELAAIRREISEVRTQQSATARNIASLDERLASLEEKVDRRLQETRPIWEEVKAEIKKLNGKFDLPLRDFYDVRADVSLHEPRSRLLEHRLTS